MIIQVLPFNEAVLRAQTLKFLSALLYGHELHAFLVALRGRLRRMVLQLGALLHRAIVALGLVYFHHRLP